MYSSIIKTKLTSTLHQYNLRQYRKLMESGAELRQLFIKLYSERADIIERKKRILRDRREGLVAEWEAVADELIKAKKDGVERKLTEDELRILDQGWNRILEQKKIDNDWKFLEKVKVVLERIASNLEEIQKIATLSMQKYYNKENLSEVLRLAFIFTCGYLLNPWWIVGVWIFRKFYKSIYADPSLLDNLPDMFDLF